ncbi:DUF3188 domain-containing protein [Synechococcus sp. BMK-MC-1]|jgi:hypothetical protein|uniref:DUF3188 domain-containing protein n=1 Tax=Synechococcus sp. BMK-MC-1 TaxID=1442551 RepID=UPI00164684D1|nr:DUF3188 domain-containing protein [Synechococcus sp. BMK-MC-1]QNI66294.1 membrane protein of unknown function DUF3188 [Synechococcus sp. BMK-MC-1]
MNRPPRTRLHVLLSLAAPLLVLLGVVALLQREGADRLQSLPAILVGAGLMVHAVVGRRRRRHRLLLALRRNRFEES